jgi:hypothetical protein
MAGDHHMLHRFAMLAAICVLTPVGTAAPAFAQPDPPPPGVPVSGASAGSQPSNPPDQMETPDGCKLTVGGTDESAEPVPPLTSAVTSREFDVSGTFTGSVQCGSN